MTTVWALWLMAALPCAAPAQTPGPFVHPVKVTLQGFSGDVMEPFISRDNTTLYFNNSNAVPANTDIFVASRIDDTHFQLTGRLAGVDQKGTLEGVPSLDTSGNFYFITNRSYAQDLKTVYAGSLLNGVVQGVAPVNGISREQPGWLNMDAEIDASGRFLYYTDNYYSNGMPQSSVIKVAGRDAGGFRVLTRSDALLQSVNTVGLNYAPSSSADGRELFFTRYDPGVQNAHPMIYVAQRDKIGAPFGPAVPVDAATGFVEGPSLSMDGLRLYYHKREGQHFAIYMLKRSANSRAHE